MLKAFSQGTGVQYPYFHLKIYKNPSNKAQKDNKYRAERKKRKTTKPLIS